MPLPPVLRRIVPSLLAFACLMYLPGPGVAAQENVSMDVRLELFGEALQSDAAPRIIDGSTYVPLRAFCETLLRECYITWDDAQRTARVQSENFYLTASVGASYLLCNETELPLTGEVRLFEGRTFVPVRPLAQACRAEVTWIDETRTVMIAAPDFVAGAQKEEAALYTAEDLYWLSRIIYAESGAEPFEGQVAVGNVVLNRLKNPSYPDTIYDVIFDRNYAVQFEPTENGRIYHTPSQTSIRAAECALTGENYAGGCLYFFNPAKSTGGWIVENRSYVITIGNHDFYA